MKVLITRKIPKAGIDILQKYPQIQIDYRQGPPLSKAEMQKAVKDVDALLPVIPDVIDKDIIDSAGSNLKVISTYSVGYDHIDIKYATEKKIYVANTPGDKTTQSVAEHTLALILALGAKLVDADEYCRQGLYKYWDPMIYLGTRAYGKTLGIIGCGRIGRSLIKMVRGLDMKVLYTDKECLPPELDKEYNAKFVDLPTLLQNSDYISIHVNLCEETRHLIGSKEFRLMKPEAILINTSRGPVVDEDALVEALEQGIIQGAGLDVFEHEPKIHPKLFSFKNVILTPHIASGTREVRIQMAMLAAQNIVDVLIDKKQPTHIVNKELCK